MAPQVNAVLADGTPAQIGANERVVQAYLGSAQVGSEHG
jgi:ABC-type branched-subunit amino acid transport system ATPase component